MTELYAALTFMYVRPSIVTLTSEMSFSARHLWRTTMSSPMASDLLSTWTSHSESLCSTLVPHSASPSAIHAASCSCCTWTMRGRGRTPISSSADSDVCQYPPRAGSPPGASAQTGTPCPSRLRPLTEEPAAATDPDPVGILRAAQPGFDRLPTAYAPRGTARFGSAWRFIRLARPSPG